MAEEVARLVAVVEANLKGFTKGMEDMQKIADRRFGALERTMKRTETAFGTTFGRGLNTLATRFLGISAAIGILNRIAREAAETNDEVKASVERMNEAYRQLGQSAGPVIAATNNLMAQLLESVNNVVIGIRRASNEMRNSPLLGGPGGINIPIAPNPFTTFARTDPTTGNVIPGPAGFPVSGVTDVTPKKPEGGKTVAERERAIEIETTQKVQDAIGDIIRKRLDDDNEYRAKAFEEARRLQNEAKEAELDDIDDFFVRRRAAEDEADLNAADNRQNQADFEKTINAERLGYAADFFGALSQLSTNASEEQKSIVKAASLAQAIILGYLAVQRALAEIPPPLNIPAAAAAAALAAVQVANIAAMEHGGRVRTGTPYIVGEKRPELFVPDQSGTIIPNIPRAMVGNSGDAAAPVTISIDARGAQLGVAEQIEAAMVRTLKTVERRLPRMMDIAVRDHR